MLPSLNSESIKKSFVSFRESFDGYSFPSKKIHCGKSWYFFQRFYTRTGVDPGTTFEVTSEVASEPVPRGDSSLGRGSIVLILYTLKRFGGGLANRTERR